MTTNQKPFFDVFPTLEIRGVLHDKLEQAKVERVSATKQKDRLTVYLFSTRLILKEDIWAAEKEIKGQLFPHAQLQVRIRERFELSSQYTPENLLDVYRESILAELREYSYVEYNAFRTAKITFPEEGHILLTVEDSVVSRSKEPELVRILEKILVERCGLQAQVEIAYGEARSGRHTEDDELKIQMRVNEICRHAGTGRAGNDAQADGLSGTAGRPGSPEAGGQRPETGRAAASYGSGSGESGPEYGQNRQAFGKGPDAGKNYSAGARKKGQSDAFGTQGSAPAWMEDGMYGAGSGMGAAGAGGAGSGMGAAGAGGAGSGMGAAGAGGASMDMAAQGGRTSSAGQEPMQSFGGAKQSGGFGSVENFSGKESFSGKENFSAKESFSGKGSFTGKGGFSGKGNIRRGEFRRNGDGSRPLRQSDDPNVIYGRDFEEEAMPIEDVIGEMGSAEGRYVFYIS